MARTGRPRVNKESRDIKLTFRLSQSEKDKISEVATKLGTSRINAVLKGIELLEQQLDD
nr:MAG TPA: NikA, BACTERIAL CONJUGATION, RELAXASE, DNA [Caudoviricetes sp.]